MPAQLECQKNSIVMQNSSLKFIAIHATITNVSNASFSANAYLVHVDVSSLNHSFRTALLASQVLPKISRGDLYQQVEWVIMEAHSQLLDILMKTQKTNTALIAQRCQRLSAFIKRSTVPEGSPDLMALQGKVFMK